MTGDFFVSCVDGAKTALILGPFRDEELCRQYAYIDPKNGGDRTKHMSVITACHVLDPKSHFYSFGMVKTKDGRMRSGVLQEADPAWDHRFKWENMIIVSEKVV